jgi:hypothetical protein
MKRPVNVGIRRASVTLQHGLRSAALLAGFVAAVASGAPGWIPEGGTILTNNADIRRSFRENRHQPPRLEDQYTIHEPQLEAFFPGEYGSLVSTFSSRYLAKSAAMALDLVTKTTILATNADVVAASRRERLEACCAAWRVALRVSAAATNSDGMEARNMCLTAWVDGLSKAATPAAVQVAALGSVWDPAFATEGLWQIYDRSNDVTTLSAFAFMVYWHGGPTDWNRLKRKLDLGIRGEGEYILRNALAWRDWLEDPTGDPGPMPSVSPPSTVWR